MQREARRIYGGFRRRVLDWAFNQRIIARLLGRECVLCLGDSHVGIFQRVRVPGVWFRQYSIGGATASGILNPISQTESFKLFTARLARARSWHHILLLLGEVDCGFLIWHRANRLGLTVDEQLELTLDSYTTFITGLLGQGFKSVIVLSAPLPTIDDSGEAAGPVASLRVAVTATKAERTELTLRFNAELQKRCVQLGVMFIDATSGHLDPETGLVDRHFLRANARNHHLAPGPYGDLIAAELSHQWAEKADVKVA
jgi:hypothetical protein